MEQRECKRMKIRSEVKNERVCGEEKKKKKKRSKGEKESEKGEKELSRPALFFSLSTLPRAFSNYPAPSVLCFPACSSCARPILGPLLLWYFHVSFRSHNSVNFASVHGHGSSFNWLQRRPPGHIFFQQTDRTQELHVKISFFL